MSPAGTLADLLEGVPVQWYSPAVDWTFKGVILDIRDRHALIQTHSGIVMVSLSDLRATEDT